ncbi:oxidoreductase-like domain-containing protein [Thermomonas sp.]|uniref:oxidoreductase-like domain-containing protein n=1 Tax=Thermomonas sp. TaxID=1971895 RepID=UPI001DD30A4A|nr:oxidoreductase-like domain-containing protein [Thermomonas sp.]MBZ0087851.1 oxidoreductase-like domain-containing protein [Thermomonas sp.]HRO63791.1 oxidoreductase-like domain-containing protein [Thermomonas sp.]
MSVVVALDLLDPKPLPPERPLASECCDSGCDRCVQDVYADELADYEAALQAWRSRHPESGS